MDYLGRQVRLREALQEARVDALLVTHLPNIHYLCGFSGSSGALLIHAAGSVFFTDSRYTQQAKAEVRARKTVITKKAPLLAAAESITRQPRSSRTAKSTLLGIEAQYLSVASQKSLSGALSRHIRLREAPALVERARMVKDAEEISLIRSAVELGASLFDRALATIRPGVSEVVVAAEMEYAARKAGAESMAFETIVASGPRAALPHGRASTAAVRPEGFVVCDFGVILHGYCSDRTRTVYVGVATAEARRTYDAVLASQMEAINAVRPGVKVEQVDRAARKTLQKKGLAKYFTHSAGHGVGLEIHEAPRVAKGQQEILQPGMVMTIEPGVYLPGQWGVRIEDMLVVTEQGCEVLSPTQKEFIEIG
ncbi:MAG TPA: Xaa-Pro peptidase family protein [Terriglobales bacterium]|nr:Xaa-Pro peptidase family protein [Terriglobales bacterium]